jgi:yecA family protein
MTYQVINAIVVQSDADLSAGYAHGMATGMLCANDQAQNEEWLAELFRHGAPPADDDKMALIQLFEDTRSLLASDDYEFDLLLPDDDVSLSEQVEALTYWCQGFLMGVGFTHATSELSKEAREILKDMIEFTKLDTEAEGEEDESDFMEITEYMRSAVLLLRSELNQSSSGHTVH